jgi:nucleoside-diphosphate-sugar epimerase
LGKLLQTGLKINFERNNKVIEKPRILLTGCAGYVGGAFLMQAIAKGYHVRCIEKLIYGGQHISGLIYHPKVEFFYGDIRDKDFINNALDGIDTVVHLAAIVGDLPCQVAPKLSVQINFNATKQLALEAKKKGVKRFIFASTCSNYGVTDHSVPADEDCKLKPVSLYSETKVDCERFLHSISDDKFHVTSLRFATAHGLSFRTRFDLTVNSFAYQAITEHEIIVFAADLWRPFIHVSDMANILFLIIEADEEKISGEIFNAGSNAQNYTKRETVMILKELCPDLKVKFVTKEDDKRSYRVDFTKIETKLGFVPSKTVRDGFAEVINALRDGILTADDYDGNKLEALKVFYAEQEKILTY